MKFRRRSAFTALAAAIAPAALLTASAGAGLGFNFQALPPVVFPNNHFPTHLASADFNGDGHPDIVVPGRDVDGLAYVLFNTGLGSFGAPVPLVVGGQTDYVQVGDIDGDGIADLVFAYRSRPSGIAVMRGIAGGSFHPVEHFKAGRELRGVALRDFNGDGHLDVVGVDYAGFQILVWTNNGQGQFSVTSSERLNEEYFGLVYPGSVVAGDLDGDGDHDLVVTSTGAGRVNVLLNRGDGTFHPEIGHRPPIVQGTLPGLTSSALGDMDGDGDLDIVTPWIMGFADQRMGVMLNNTVQGSPGVFSSPINFNAAQFGVSWWAALGDFNGDGDLDVATGHGLPGTFGLMANLAAQGQFFLLQVQLLEIGQFVRSILVLDVDSDGDLDLVLLEAPTNQVIVMRNDTPQGAAGGSDEGGIAGGGPEPQPPPDPIDAKRGLAAAGAAAQAGAGGGASPGPTADRNGDGALDGADLAIELGNLAAGSLQQPSRGEHAASQAPSRSGRPQAPRSNPTHDGGIR